MIYSFTPFFNEYEMLEMRLTYLDDVVDKFVIAESDRTFNGTPKPWNFEVNRDRYKKWEHKIEYVQYKMPVSDEYIQKVVPNLADNIPMARDNLQRGALYHSETWQNMTDQDFGILSDLDEFPFPEVVKGISDVMQPDDLPIQLKSQMFAYYMNYAIPTPWWAITIFTGKQKDSNLAPASAHNPAQYFRNFRVGGDANQFNVLQFQGAQGFHFTYMGGPKRIMYKIREFAHQEWSPHPDSFFLDTIKNKTYYPTREPITVISIDKLPKVLADLAVKFKYVGPK